MLLNGAKKANVLEELPSLFIIAVMSAYIIGEEKSMTVDRGRLTDSQSVN